MKNGLRDFGLILLCGMGAAVAVYAAGRRWGMTNADSLWGALAVGALVVAAIAFYLVRLSRAADIARAEVVGAAARMEVNALTGQAVGAPSAMFAPGAAVHLAREVLADERPHVEADRVGRWRTGCRRFLAAGRLAGTYAQRELSQHHELDAGWVRPRYMTDSAYRVYSRLLQSAGVLRATRAGTRLVVSYVDAIRKIERDALDWPAGDAPDVELGIKRVRVVR